MAADMMAIAGMSAAPATPAAAVAAPEGAEGFAEVITAAMSAAQAPAAQSTAAQLAPGDPALGDAGIDVLGLLVSLAGTPEGNAGVPVPMSDGLSDGPWLDRDAEAEGLQGALASMLLGALMRPVVSPPLQAMPGLAAPVVAAVAAHGAVDGAVLVEADAVVATAAQGSAGVVTVDVPTMPAPGVGDLARQDVAPSALTEPVANTSMAYAAPAVAAAAVRSVAPGAADELVDGELAPDASGAKLTSTVASTGLAPAPAEAPTAANVAAVTRGIELADVGPAERRADDRAPVVAVADGSRPAPVIAAASTAAAPEVVAATDGQSLASAVANSVQQATLRGGRELTLALNPPDLGHLTVQITEDASGGVSISIHAASSEAHDLLQQHLPALRSGLEQREVRVEQLQVDHQAPSAGLDWTDGRGRESSGRRDGSDDGQPQWSPLAALRRGAEAALPSGAVTATHSSTVDVRA